jgi:cytochrome c oxidase subunit 2
MNNETVQLPAQWSTFAPEIDGVFYFIYWVSVVMFVAVVGAALYFVWKYRRQKPGEIPEPTGHNTVMEVTWTVAPLVLLVYLFHVGFQGYVKLTVPPANAIEVRARARKWSWDFEYPNGAHTVNELYVPVNRPVRVVISSEDVLHALFIPEFRVKRDAVPGYYSTLWFEATRTTGRETQAVRFFCAEYCGAAETAGGPSNPREGRRPEYDWTGHFSMGGWTYVLDQADFDRKMEELNGPPTVNGQIANPAQWGEILYRQQNCNTCHSVDGSNMTGPTWKGIFGHEVELVSGQRVNVDEQYIRTSILQPNAQVVRGYSPVMPTYAGSLNDRQIDAIIAYIRTLH